MNKKRVISLIILVTVAILYFTIYFVQNIKIEENQRVYWFEDNQTDTFFNYKVVRCNLNIFKPKIAFVSEKKFEDLERNDLNIYISEYKNSLFGDIKEVFLGVTTLDNILFPELLKMVKEDCSQFQEGNKVGEIEWIYSPAEKEEERLEEEERIRLRDEEEQKEYEAFMALPEEERNKLIEENKRQQEEWDALSEEEKIEVLRKKFYD